MVLLVTPLSGQTGDLRVVVSTTGSAADDDGYVVALDTLRQSVSVNGSAVFSRVTAGSHTAVLLDVSEDCAVRGENPRKLMIAQGGVAEIRFQVECNQGQPARPEPVERRVEPVPLPSPEPPVESAPSPAMGPSALPMGYWLVGHWVAVIEPPGFPSYPVTMTFYSEQTLGEVVGHAEYESTSPCAYDLLLEFVGDNFLVVAQQLLSGDCSNGGRVVLTREAGDLLAEWLTPEKNVWFEAVFKR
jgi:hypothetical protein